MTLTALMANKTIFVNMEKYTPLDDRVLIRPVAKKETEITDGGILIPETVKKEVAEGEVVAVGSGRYALDTGVFIPNYLLPGDIVLFGANQGMPLAVNKEELRLLREGDVLLVVGRPLKNPEKV
jgi:chaperonin GroES